ncbi:hypothetical protein [Tsukamurella soli]|uniref:Uncharacterized protein n=1 Tax=Tsukamurella soli TaxID=644556 RepID=A0ABP8JEP6_9ACTN
MRYNPPPNWPPAPEDWRPEPGWEPDPSWPDPPPGWEVWVGRDSRAARRWAIAIGALVAVLVVVAAAVYYVVQNTGFRCWNGSRGTAGGCPAITGEAGLEWLAPTRRGTDGAVMTGRTCGPAPDVLPARTSVEAVECSWPDGLITADIERYASATVVPSGGAREQWLVGGVKYGLSAYSKNSSGGAQRVFYYDGLPYVITVMGTADAIAAAVPTMGFRSLTTVRDGGRRK